MTSALWWTLALLHPTSIVAILIARNCVPLDYVLRIDFTDKQHSMIRGTVQMTLGCRADISQITLNWRNQFIYENETTVRLVGSTTDLEVARISFDLERDLMMLDLAQTVKKDSQYVLTVSFGTMLDSAGLIGSSFWSESDGGRTVLVSKFYPNYAHTFFPCIDEPNLITPFNLTMIYEPGLTGVSNLRLVEEYSTENSSVQKYASNRIAPFQLAFSLNDLTEIEGCEESNFSIYGYTDGSTDIDSAINYTAYILEYFSESHGLKWPKGNLSLIAAAEHSLEYSGATGLLGIPYAVDPLEFILSLSRGLARQLLLEMVWLDSWTDVWIVEGLVWYFGYEAWNFMLPEQDMSSWYDGCWSMLDMDMLTSSGQLVNGTKSRLTVEELGQKAFCVLQTIARMIGPTNFRNGIKEYVKIGGGIINMFRHILHIENVTGNPPINDVLKSWFGSSGVSILNVTRSANSTVLQVTQLRNSSGTSPWIRVNSSSLTSIWVSSKQIRTNASLSVPVNLEHLIYYKILYDAVTYDLLATQRRWTKQDSTVSRAQLINDVLDFAWFGHTNYSVAIKLVNTLSNETDYLAWARVLNHFEKLWYVLKIVSKQDTLKNYLQAIIIPVYSKIGVFTNTKDLSTSEKRLQTLIATWACRLDIANCSSNASKLFINLDQVPDHLIGVVLRESTSSANQSDWYLLHGSYNKSTPNNRLIHSIRAIGSFAKNLPSVMELINDKSFLLQQRVLLEALLEADPNPLLLYSTLLLEYHNIDEFLRKKLMRKIAQRIVHADDLLILQKMSEKYAIQSEEFAALQDAIELAQLNVEWLKTRSNEFLLALKQK